MALLCTPSFRLLYTDELANNKIIRPRVGLYFPLPALLIAIAGIRGAAARGLPGRSSSAAGVAQMENRSSANPALSQAENALAGNRLDEALAKCRDALAQDPKSARAYYILRHHPFALGKPDEERGAWLIRTQNLPMLYNYPRPQAQAVMSSRF